MLKNLQLKNENFKGIKKTNSKLVSVDFPVKGIAEFFKFNFSKRAEKNVVVLNPFNLPKQIEIKLYSLCYKMGWSTSYTIIEALNLPEVDPISVSPMSFKYVYDFVTMHKTNKLYGNLDVDNNVLIKPVNKKKFQSFYSI